MLTRLPTGITGTMLQDAEQRDPVTARRMQLLLMLWLHRYLTRAVLIQRIETILGYAAFGKKSWQDAFYRDMRVVKNAFHKLAIRSNTTVVQTGPATIWRESQPCTLMSAKQFPERFPN